MTFRFHAPERAHSGTDVMIEVVQESVVFLGDNVTHKRIARMDDASFRAASLPAKSLQGYPRIDMSPAMVQLVTPA